MVDATQWWFNRLGGAPSAQSGHALRIRETLENEDPDKPFYCTADGNTWNNAIPIDTLAVIPWQNEGSSATVGWQPGKTWNNFIRVEPKPSLKTLVHEWGHVFGTFFKVNTQCLRIDKSLTEAQGWLTSTREAIVSLRPQHSPPL
jgi:hypothetical protein